MNDSIDFLKFPSGASVRSVKKDARKLSKVENILHSEALDRLAEEHGGGKTWAIAIQRLQRRTLPAQLVQPLPVHPRERRIFHRVQIADLIFEGHVIGPDVHLLAYYAENPRGFAGDVALGVAEIFRTQADPIRKPRDSGDEVYWLCKYDAWQTRIRLSSLSDRELLALSDEFGISFEERRLNVHFEVFFRSPAFQSLCAWINRHPRMAKRGLETNYLDWYRQAVGLPRPANAKPLVTTLRSGSE